MKNINTQTQTGQGKICRALFGPGLKKLISVLLAAALVLPGLAGCGSGQEGTEKDIAAPEMGSHFTQKHSEEPEHRGGEAAISGFIPESCLIREVKCDICGETLSREELKSGIDNNHFVFSVNELITLLNSYEDLRQLMAEMYSDYYSSEVDIAFRLEYETGADNKENVTIVIYNEIDQTFLSIIIPTAGGMPVLKGQEDEHFVDELIFYCPIDDFCGLTLTTCFAACLSMCNMDSLYDNMMLEKEILDNDGFYYVENMIFGYQEEGGIMSYAVKCEEVYSVDSEDNMHVYATDPETDEKIDIVIPPIQP